MYLHEEIYDFVSIFIFTNQLNISMFLQEAK